MHGQAQLTYPKGLATKVIESINHTIIEARGYLIVCAIIFSKFFGFIQTIFKVYLGILIFSIFIRNCITEVTVGIGLKSVPNNS